MLAQKQQLELDMEQWTSSKYWKEYIKTLYCHPTYLTYMQSASWKMPEWMKHKLESRLSGEIPATSDVQMIPLYGKKWKGTKKPLDEGERREWNRWLKIQLSKKNNIMTSSPITSWQVDGEKVGKLTDFIYLGSKITVDGDCSLKIKRCLLLGRKAMTSLDSILRNRDSTLFAKVHIVKTVVFPVVMYGCESWTIKKTEHWRINAFKLWGWRRFLNIPWTAGSNQSILREINPDYPLEGLLPKLKLH